MAATTVKFKIPFVSFEMVTGATEMPNKHELDTYTPVNHKLFGIESFGEMDLSGISTNLEDFAFKG